MGALASRRLLVRVAGRLSSWLALAGGAITIAVAALVTVSVVLRWLTGQAISGDFEIVQMTTALAVFAYLPACQWRGGNIVVDVFTLNWPKPALRLLDAGYDVLYAVVAAFISWRLIVGATDAVTSKTETMVLGLPEGWAIAMCAAMAGFLSVAALASALNRFSGEPA